MTRFPERLPAALSGRLSSAGQAIYSRQGREVDVAIGGIPFALANYPDSPRTVETIPVRKDQVDTERDPGEQSLSSWWRRSQSSFHEGAGLLYAENTAIAGFSSSFQPSNGYADSEGVNPFVEGQLTLLYRMDADTGTAATCTRVSTYYPPGGATINKSAVSGGALYNGTLAGAYANFHAPAAKTVVDGFFSGNYWYDVCSDGTLFSGTVTPAVGTSWPLGSAPAYRLGFGKFRLWVIGGTKIWQPDLTLAGGTAQNPIYTNPLSGWQYTSMCETPGAMLFAGNDGVRSSIQAIALTSAGGLPTLSGATTVATLPDGEIVQEIACLAGSFIGIGTNQGFRVGIIDSGSGSISYGPLLFQPSGVSSCTALTTQGRFFIVAFATPDSRSLAYRIDTSVDLGDGVFAYSKDIDCGTNGYITSLASVGTSRLLASTSGGTVPWIQSTTNYVSSGYVLSGRIRYRTTELKSYKFLNVEIQPLVGAIQTDLIKEGGSTFPLGNITKQGDVFSDAFAITLDPMRYASVKLTLTPGGGGTSTPVVNSFLLRALPAVTPQRLITLPLRCYDLEQAKSGQRYGGDGYALDRLTALQLLEDAAETVVFQDFSLSQSSGQIVTIEGIKFIQNTPAKANRADEVGGTLLVQLRTLA